MTFQEGDQETSLWNEKDGMYYDAISFGPGYSVQLPIRSLVGLIPLYGTLVLEAEVLKRFPGFKKRMEWFINNRPDVSARNMANMKSVFSTGCSDKSDALVSIQREGESNGGCSRWRLRRGW
jgi:hypothetical protein